MRAPPRISRPLLAALCAVYASLSAGCRKEPPKPDPLAPPASMASIALPPSTNDERPADAMRVYALTNGLFVDAVRVGDGPLRGEGYSPKDRLTSGSLAIDALARHVNGRREALLYVDETLSARALVEIAFTLKFVGVTHASLMTKGKSAIRAIPIDLSTPRRPCRPAASASSSASAEPATPPSASASSSAAPAASSEADCDPGLALAVLMTRDGSIVIARGRRLAEGCKAPGSGLSVKGRDATALRACVDVARGASTDHEATIAPSLDVTVGEVVQALDALRGGKAPFTTIHLGVL